MCVTSMCGTVIVWVQVSAIAVSPCGRFLASGQKMSPSREAVQVRSVTWDLLLLLLSLLTQIFVWDAREYRLLHGLSGLDGDIRMLYFSPARPHCLFRPSYGCSFCGALSFAIIALAAHLFFFILRWACVTILRTERRSLPCCCGVWRARWSVGHAGRIAGVVAQVGSAGDVLVGRNIAVYK